MKLVECFSSSGMSCNTGKEFTIVTLFIATSDDCLRMMALSRRRHLVEYIKAVLGIGILFGILILIGQINANFPN